MRFMSTILAAILLGLYCAFMVPALITKNTPKHFEIAVSLLVILFTLTPAMLLVAINKDRNTKPQTHKEPS